MQHSTNLVDFLNSNYTIKERNHLLTRSRSKIVIYFRPRSKKKGSNNGVQWLYIRLRINGVLVRSDISTGISFDVGTWDKKSQQIIGDSHVIREKNRAIAQIENDLLTLYNDLRVKGVTVTADMLKALYRGGSSQSNLGLVAYYDSYLSSHAYTISKGTIKAWKCRFKMFQIYLKSIQQQHITIEQVTPKWAMDYHRFILQNKSGLNHARRAVKAISAVMDYAVVQGDLDNNPLKSLKLPRSRQKPIKYLTSSEIEQLQTCPFFDDRLQKSMDCFLIQTYTGMGYNELLLFDAKEHLKIDSTGQPWIMIRRGKSGTLSTIPLITEAQKLFEKYKYNLPVISNQKMNDFIKEAAKIAGIENPEKMQTHLGRKTAGTFLLNQGVPLETVSKVLGHKSVKMTEMYYAELLTETIKSNFKKSGLL